jgi:hypothetical protein
VEIVHFTNSIASGPEVSQARLPGKNPLPVVLESSRDPRMDLLGGSTQGLKHQVTIAGCGARL